MKLDKTKIALAVAIAAILTLGGMAFFADLGDSEAFHSWESSYDEVAHDPWHCRVFGC